MKRLICCCLAIALFAYSPAIATTSSDTIDDWSENTDNLWRTGAGAHDGSSTAISASIIGWGVGLALGIAILAAVLHQSKAGSGHSHCK